MNNRILVFGSQGYLGRVITRLLSEGKYFEPVEVFRQGPKLLAKVGGTVQEYEHFEALGASLRGNPVPIAAVNAAAFTSKEDSHFALERLVEANVTVPSHIAKICADVGIERLIHFGTFSTSVDGISPSPQTFYAASKAAGYEALRYFSRSQGLKVVVLEPFDIYAADHPHGKVISVLAESLSEGSGVKLSKGEQELAPVHALDVAKASIQALTVPISEQYSIWSLAGPEVLTLKQLATEIAIALGKESNLNLLNFTNPYRGNEIMKAKPRFTNFPMVAPLRVREGILVSALSGFEPR